MGALVRGHRLSDVQATGRARKDVAHLNVDVSRDAAHGRDRRREAHRKHRRAVAEPELCAFQQQQHQRGHDSRAVHMRKTEALVSNVRSTGADERLFGAAHDVCHRARRSSSSRPLWEHAAPSIFHAERLKSLEWAISSGVANSASRALREVRVAFLHPSGPYMRAGSGQNGRQA